MPAPHLVDAIDRLGSTTYSGEAFRHVAPRWHPLSGAGARAQGGRWNPPGSFATLYLAVDEATAIAEFRRMATRSGLAVGDFIPRRLYRFELELKVVVDLTANRDEWPVPLADLDFQARDLSAFQAIGEAAEHLGREAIRAPSATGSGDILAIFTDRLRPDSTIESVGFKVWEAPP